MTAEMFWLLYVVGSIVLDAAVILAVWAYVPRSWLLFQLKDED